MNGYDLSRAWFDYSFENPHKVKPNHTAIFFFAIEHCNRLGWKKVFGFPTSMVLEAIGLKSYSSYKKHFDEIVEFGFFEVHEYSKNQFSSNIIALTLNAKANAKALDKAFIKHSSKQQESNVSIDKPINNKPITNDDVEPSSAKENVLRDIRLLKSDYLKNERLVSAMCNNQKNKLTPELLPDRLHAFNAFLTEENKMMKTENDYASHFRRWHLKTVDILPQKLSNQDGKKVGDEHNGSTIVFFTDEGKPVVSGQPYGMKRLG